MAAIQIQSELLYSAVRDQWNYYAMAILDQDGYLDDQEIDVLIRTMMISCDRPTVPKSIKTTLAKLRKRYPDMEQYEKWIYFRGTFMYDVIMEAISCYLSRLEIDYDDLFHNMLDEWKNCCEEIYDYDGILSDDELEVLLKTMTTEYNTPIISNSVMKIMMKLRMHYPKLEYYECVDYFQEIFSEMIMKIVFRDMQLI